ncbi:MAG: SDR family oxidoreductase [Bacteroidota bacterium]
MQIMVTGGSGYIASWIVSFLLADGHHVVATVRDKNNREKNAFLHHQQEKYPGKLDLHEADLLKEGSFDEGMKGCDVVIHSASPFLISGIKDARKQLIEPAVKGTQNVLKAVRREPKVKKVVLTSSVAAIYGDNADIRNIQGDKFTEEHWNESSNEKHQAYSYSKKAAEETAWQMTHDELSHWELAVINPGFVIGPSLTKRKDSTSINFMISFLNGTYKAGVPDLYFGVVDVRDVAKAHVKAALTPGITGRHILVGETKSTLEMAQTLHKHYAKKYPVPKKKIPKALLYLAGPFAGFSWKFIHRNIGIPIYFDHTRAKKHLGIEFTTAEQSIKEQAEQIIQDKLI